MKCYPNLHERRKVGVAVLFAIHFLSSLRLLVNTSILTAVAKVTDYCHSFVVLSDSVRVFHRFIIESPIQLR
jgi:hypothetical protein